MTPVSYVLLRLQVGKIEFFLKETRRNSVIDGIQASSFFIAIRAASKLSIQDGLSRQLNFFREDLRANIASDGFTRDFLGFLTVLDSFGLMVE